LVSEPSSCCRWPFNCSPVRVPESANTSKWKFEVCCRYWY